jgi:hypothetical protein
MYLLINLFTLIRGIPLRLEYKDQMQWYLNGLSAHKKLTPFRQATIFMTLQKDSDRIGLLHFVHQKTDQVHTLLDACVTHYIPSLNISQQVAM